jgi:hypothetical protein
MQYDKYTFFYRASSPFSNHHDANFTDSTGTVYTSSEQYMMHQKALLFEDFEVAELILREPNPKQQKLLGRKIRGFDEQVWEKNARDIVYEGCKLKFEQNPGLLRRLLETRETLLVEASPYDKIWGIGLSEEDPRINDPRNWEGTNWLGEILTDLRDTIISTLKITK